MEASNNLSEIRVTAEAENRGETYETLVTSGGHSFIADELPELGGKDLGPDPFGYLCGALASCTAITLRMYVGRKGWDLSVIRVRVDLQKDADPATGNSLFHTVVTYSGQLTDEQEARLLYIARACPVHRLLSHASSISTLIEKSS
ncbi:MAG TPA: OsmC family protein [Sphingobacteriaceae bacterium]